MHQLQPKILSDFSALIVEDGKLFSQFAKDTISSFGITKISQIYTPEETLALLDDTNFYFDLILVDYLFSHSQITGDQIVKKIKDINPAIIIFAFSYTDKRNQQLIAVGADGIAGKSQKLKPLKEWLTNKLKTIPQ